MKPLIQTHHKLVWLTSQNEIMSSVLQTQACLFLVLTEKGTDQGHLKKMLISACLKLLHWCKLSHSVFFFCRCMKPWVKEGFSSVSYFGRLSSDEDEHGTTKKLKGNTGTSLKLLFSQFQHSPSNLPHLLITLCEPCLQKI